MTEEQFDSLKRGDVVRVKRTGTVYRKNSPGFGFTQLRNGRRYGASRQLAAKSVELVVFSCLTCEERPHAEGCDGLCTECYQAALSAPQYDDHVFYGLPHAGHTQEQIARGEHYQDVRATFVRKTARPLPAPATAAVQFPPCCDDQTPAAHHNGNLYCQACDTTLGHVAPQLTPHAIGLICVALGFYIDSTKEQAADPTQANARSYLESRARQAGELLATFEGLRDGDGLEG